MTQARSRSAKVRYKAPDNVSDGTKKFIKEVLKELNAKSAIQNIDIGAIHMLAISYEMWMQASEELLEDGPIMENKYGDKIPHPAQTIATKNYGQVMKIMTEYGLTIKSRTNIKSISTTDKKDSPLDEFFKSKK